MEKIRLGVAGCGASVWMHGPALARQEHAEVVAWMDPSYGAAARAFLAEWEAEIHRLGKAYPVDQIRVPDVS